MDVPEDAFSCPAPEWPQFELQQLKASGRWDVVIVGAGPAGAICALETVRSGIDVLLLDRAKFPREKVCGDALIPDALHLLERVGLLENVTRAGRRLNSMVAYSPSRHNVTLPGRFVTIQRRLLDSLLASAAIEAGATFAHGKVEQIVRDSGGLRVMATSGNTEVAIRAKVVVLATGANDRLLQQLGVKHRYHPTAAAIRCYVHAASGPDQLVASLDRTILPGYGWVFPMPNGIFNVGCGLFFSRDREVPLDLHRRFRDFCEGFPPLRELMGSAKEVSRPVGAALKCGLLGAPEALPEGVLAIGETIGTTYPLTGEGIGKAMQSGALAARAISEAFSSADFSCLSGFGEELRQELGRKYAGYLLAEEWLSVPWFLDFVAHAGGWSRWVRGQLSGVLDETTDLERMFRAVTALRRFLRVSR